MATGVTERVPVKIVRKASDGTSPVLEMEAERFMGVLRHPVARADMLHKFGVDQRGCRITARWHGEAPDEHPVKAGDLLEIEGESHVIRGVRTMPGCYLEIYTDEH
jgi:hypothetical protein